MPTRIYVTLFCLLLSFFETLATERIVKVNRKNLKHFYSLIAKFTSGEKVCLITNQSASGQLLLIPGESSNSSYLEETFSKNNVKIIKLLTPEHGLSSLEEVEDKKSKTTASSKYELMSLYNKPVVEIQKLLHNCTDILFDLPDAGIRPYTYRTILTRTLNAVATMKDKPQYMLIDRPNPAAYLGTYGPLTKKEQYSFLGEDSIAFFPGYTYAEISRRYISQQNLDIKIVLFTMDNYYTKKTPDQSIVLPPSPNLPDDRALHCYWIGIFLEGSNLDYGRNSNDPFCTFGHRDIDYRRPLPNINGVRIVPFQYKASAGKFSNKQLKGYRIIAIDLHKFDPIEAAYTLYSYFIETYPDLDIFYKYSKGTYKIDLLTGSKVLRLHLQSRKRYIILKRKFEKQMMKFKQSMESYRLY